MRFGAALAQIGRDYLTLFERAAAKRGRNGGRARLGVPGNVAVLRGTTDRDRVDRVGVAVAVAVVVVLAAVARRPHIDRAESFASL